MNGYVFYATQFCCDVTKSIAGCGVRNNMNSWKRATHITVHTDEMCESNVVFTVNSTNFNFNHMKAK